MRASTSSHTATSNCCICVFNCFGWIKCWKKALVATDMSGTLRNVEGMPMGKGNAEQDNWVFFNKDAQTDNTCDCNCLFKTMICALGKFNFDFGGIFRNLSTIGMR